MSKPTLAGSVSVNTFAGGDLNNPETVSFTADAAAKIILCAVAVSYPGNEAGVACSWNGTAMTLIASKTTDNSNTRGVVYFFAIKIGETGFTTGMHNVVVTSSGTFSEGGNGHIIVWAYDSIDVTSSFGTPVDATGTGNSVLAVADATANDVVLDLFSSVRGNGGASTVTQTGAARTPRASVNGGGFLQNYVRVGEVDGTGSSISLAYTFSDPDGSGWNQIGITVKGAPAAGDPPTPGFSTSIDQKTVTVTDTSVAGSNPIVSVEYAYGDGSGRTASTLHTYVTGGSFTITQYVSDGIAAEQSTTHGVITKTRHTYTITSVPGGRSASITADRPDA